MPPRTEQPPAGNKAGWHRQPVAWLGAAVFVASLAGCVWLIAVSVRHADIPLETPQKVFGVPISAPTAN